MTFNNDFFNKYSKCIGYYNRAKELYYENQYEDCLFNCRKCLEGFLWQLCIQCGIDSTGLTIENMIDILKDKGIFNRDEIGILHRTRQLGNKGSHTKGEQHDKPIDKNDADLALSELEKSIRIFERNENESDFSNIKKEENVPMHLPDYFDLNRKYRGEFAYIFNINQLKMNNEYNKLYAKAQHGDIQAMLDLAIGFLPRDFKGKYAINDNQLFNYPYGKNNDFQEHSYDTRYYYWICRAADQTEIYWNNNEKDKIPFKYIATALLEATLFGFFYWRSECFYYIQSIDRGNSVYDDQYELVKKWYDHYITDGNPNASGILIHLVNKYGMDIVAPMYNQKSVNDIKYIYYCYQYLYEFVHKTMENDKHIIPKYRAIDPSDAGKSISFEMIKKYSGNSKSNMLIYKTTEAYKNNFEQNEKEKARMAEEEAKKEKEKAKKARSEFCKTAFFTSLFGFGGVYNILYATETKDKKAKKIQVIIGIAKLLPIFILLIILGLENITFKKFFDSFKVVYLIMLALCLIDMVSFMIWEKPFSFEIFKKKNK